MYFRLFIFYTHIFLFLVLSFSFSSCFIQSVNASETEYSPSSYTLGWATPQNALSSNGAYAVTSVDNRENQFYDYGMDIPGDIDKVEVGLEHYESSGSKSIEVRISWDNGNSWSNYAEVAATTETIDWIDATNLTEWTQSKLSNSNFIVEVKYKASGGGCFANNMRVRMANGSLEAIHGLSEGEAILNEEYGESVITNYIEFYEENDLPFHNVTLADGRSLIVYGEHEIVVSPGHVLKRVNHLTVDDKLLNISGEMIGIESIEIVYLRNCTNIEVSNSGLFWCEDVLIHNILKLQWTAYLDHVSVRVTNKFLFNPVYAGLFMLVFGLGFVYYLTIKD